MIFNFGIRVEISNKVPKIKSILQNYSSPKIEISDINDNARIITNKTEDLLFVKSKQETKYQTGLINFHLTTKLEMTEEELKRLIKIINVLGNGRIIKDKVKNLQSGVSIFNKLSEFKEFPEAISDLEKQIPRFSLIAWYYAPEVK